VKRRRSPSGVRRARAFAPGHVTGIFSPALEARDPRARGSRGAGLVLELGVIAEAEWDPGGPSSVVVRGDTAGPLPISEDVARRLVPTGAGRVTVRLTHRLPVGQGFGMSAAGALSTALAIAGIFSIPRVKAIEVAHLAELYGGGGLGGVAAILGGGLEVRVRPGIPPSGRVTHRPFLRRLILGIVGGPIPSPEVLADPKIVARIERVWEESHWTGRTLSPSEFLDASERFTDRIALAPKGLARTLHALRDQGAWAAQAMFGRSFFAVPRSPASRESVFRLLERAGIPAVEVSVRSGGSRRLPTRGVVVPS
jgi:pantoate kinase